MSFLSIPSQEGLFTTVKTRKCPGEEASRSPNDEDEEEDEEEDDDDAEVTRLIPRCSPVPRRRGASIHDETAEYMRIHLALSAGKRVSFADTTGGDLTDVKEFTAYDSEDEEGSARWEEEEAKYRKPLREPTYSVRPGFTALAGGALLQAVRANKVEVEQISPVESEPLAFGGIIRVLNVSFHKAVYVRSTMDGWVTHFDHPAEYVQGSNDGDTDQFSFKLSFAPPYITQGSRIEFVVRYETSEGDFWANNFSTNYAVSLVLSYEDDAERGTPSLEQTRGILKPPKVYSMDDVYDSEDEEEKAGEEAAAAQPTLFRPVPVCPVIVQPEIDIETGTDPTGPSAPPDPDLPSVDTVLSAPAVPPGDRVPSVSPEAPPPANLSSESLREPSGQSSSPRPPAPAPPPQQAQAGGGRGPPPQDSWARVPTTNADPRAALEEDGASKRPASPARLSATFDLEVAKGTSEPTAGSARRHEGSADPAASGGRARPESGGEAPEAEDDRTPSPDAPEAEDDRTPSPDAPEAEDDRTPSPDAPEAEDDRTPSPDAPDPCPTWTTPVPETEEPSTDAPRRRAEPDVSRNLMSSAVFLGGIVSLSIVLQEPSTLFFIGLLLVLRRL